MAKALGSYRGVWKKEARSDATPELPVMRVDEASVAAASARVDQASAPAMRVNQAPAASARVDQAPILSARVAPAVPLTPAVTAVEDLPPPMPVPPALLDHRYRWLLLHEHRHKLGRDLLEAGHRDPWQLAWSTVTSFGRNFRPWAHARTFALGCYLNVDMSPEILRQLRHPLHVRRYRRAMRGLWRLLEMLAQKQGAKPLPKLLWKLAMGCPPLGILVYEKQLQSLLTQSTALARENIHATT